jgi:hypothetical protein
MPIDEYDVSPCDNCDMPCDGWEAQFCCTRCHWLFGEDTPCDDCDPMDI